MTWLFFNVHVDYYNCTRYLSQRDFSLLLLFDLVFSTQLQIIKIGRVFVSQSEKFSKRNIIFDVFFPQRECIELLWDLEFSERVRRLLLLDVISSERDCIELIKERFSLRDTIKLLLYVVLFPTRLYIIINYLISSKRECIELLLEYFYSTRNIYNSKGCG